MKELHEQIFTFRLKIKNAQRNLTMNFRLLLFCYSGQNVFTNQIVVLERKREREKKKQYITQLRKSYSASEKIAQSEIYILRKNLRQENDLYVKFLQFDFFSAKTYVYKLRQLCESSNNRRSIENGSRLRRQNGGKYLFEGRKAGCRIFLAGGGKWKSQMTDKARAAFLRRSSSFRYPASLRKLFPLSSEATHLLVVRHSSPAL